MAIVTSAVSGTPCWVDLATTDLPAAAAFYGSLLGWSFEDQGEAFGHYHMARLGEHLTGGMGPLFPGGAPRPCWSVYLATEDADAAVRTVEALGGRVLQPPMDVGPHGRMAIVADPGGASVGLWQAGAVFGVEHRDAPGGLSWAEVNTRQGEAVSRFFEAFTGLDPRKIDGMDYWALHSADDRAHFGVLQMTEQWGELPPHWMPYFAVADADAATVQVQALGGAVHHGPFDSPYGRIAVCADPQGAAFTLIQLTTPS